MKKYDTYKDSGNQWIGQVPKHWGLYSLKYYLNLQKGCKPKELVEEGDLPYVTMDYIRSRDNKTCLYPSSAEGLVPISDDDILVLWDGANAGEIVKAKKGFLSSTMAVLDFDKKIGSQQYLFYLLKQMEPIFKTFANGTTIPHFDSSILLDYKYPLPPLSEQQTIVEFLDKKTGQIDQSIALLETQKTDLQAYRQALITETVTKGLNPNAPMKDSGMQWIGEIPEHWKIKKSSYIFDIIGSGTTPKSDNTAYYIEDGEFWLQTGDLNDGLITNTTKRISSLAFQDYNLQKYPIGSIVIAMYGATIGKLGLLGIPTATNQACCVLYADEKVQSNKYSFYLFSAAKREIINSANGGGQPNISQQIIRDFRLPTPPLSEQQVIAGYLDKKTNDIDAALKHIDTQITDLRAYRTALISEAVTGKIDVR